MSQLSIKLSDKADALIAQLQKEIFNRRRKKVTAAGVVETLVESGARSQSDKRFSTSWTNLIKDIEKAAKLANAHGSKPSTLSDAGVGDGAESSAEGGNRGTGEIDCSQAHRQGCCTSQDCGESEDGCLSKDQLCCEDHR